ncbi:BTB/POZ protein [Rhizophagus irregularis DAOM 181602=DAOM 197198]|nr:BTB/POZ protein [Rhizophagus irregularis DAOM 181602=DAOM 197198]
MLHAKFVKVHIKLSNTSPETFQIILEYIYGGILSLDKKDTSDLEVLATADKLNLQELVDYLQGYLIENKSEWLEQHFEFAQQISSNSNNLLKLQEFCTNLMVRSPEKVLKSLNFTSLSEKSLTSLIKRDDLQMKEIEVWEYVLKWGLAKNPTLIPDPKTWSDDDFKAMKSTLQSSLPLVRLFCLSSKEFSQKVRPYQKLLNQQLYEDLLNFYLDPDSVSSHNIQLPRIINENVEVICSLIVNSAGPYFGLDINICASSVSEDYNCTEYYKRHYEKNIRANSEGYSNVHLNQVN